MPELKKKVEVINKLIEGKCYSKLADEKLAEACGEEPKQIKLPKKLLEDIKTLLSACQLLCDTSDKMLPKIKDEDMPEHEQKHLFDLYKNGSNQRREEDILWLSKKMMGIEKALANIEIPLEENPYKLKTVETDNPAIMILKSVMIERIVSAIIQSFGQEKGGE